MKAYLVRTPLVVQRMFPKRIWTLPNDQNKVFLTFDDGPIPEVTPWVLSELKKHNAKATFFCIGANIDKNTDVFRSIVSEGHSIGNHTYHHLNGLKTDSKSYVENVDQAEAVILKHTTDKNSGAENLFRPPYGKINKKQASLIEQKGFKIVMWDILSADFDKKITNEKCLQNILNNIKVGSIIVLHDSLKAEKKLRYVLPKVLEFCSEKDWKCDSIKI